MSYACKHFGFDEDEGMRVFSIVEMFMSGHHIVTASYVFREMVENLYSPTTANRPHPEYSNSLKAALLAISIFFTLTLVVQAVCGFLLYLVGWKQRHLIICYVWIAVGCINNLFSIIILIIEAVASNTAIYYWTRFFLYLFYVFYGTWVIVDFIKWARDNHLAAGECACLEKHRVAPVINRSRARGGTSAGASTTTSGHHHQPRKSVDHQPRKSLGAAPEESSAPGHKKTSEDVGGGGARVQIKEEHKRDRRTSGASEAKSGISRASRRK